MPDTAENSPRDVARASDLEQKLGHGGNMRDAGEGAEAPAPKASDQIGGSGHIPQLEEINPHSLEQGSGSPGADADQQRASGTS